MIMLAAVVAVNAVSKLAGGELASLINACYQDDSPIGFRDAGL